MTFVEDSFLCFCVPCLRVKRENESERKGDWNSTRLEKIWFFIVGVNIFVNESIATDTNRMVLGASNKQTSIRRVYCYGVRMAGVVVVRVQEAFCSRSP